MLEHIFLEVLKMSLSASIVIIIVILIRRLIKKFPKFISYMLWSVVFFRLLCPFKIEIKASPMPNIEPTVHEYLAEKNEIPIADLLIGTAIPYISEKTEIANNDESTPLTENESKITQPEVTFQKTSITMIGECVWVSGVIVLFVYCIFSLLKIRSKVATAVRFEENIYITDKVASPFVMGLFRPKIYLPVELEPQEREYVILHEKFHIKRFDHVMKLLGFVATSIHWFNPFAWVAFTLFCNDMEMCCDEAVINKMGDNIKADYSATLLSVSVNRRFPGVIPVDFGEGNIKERIKNMKRFKKTPKGILAILVMGIIVLIVGLASTHKTTFANVEEAESAGSAADDLLVQKIPDQSEELGVTDQPMISEITNITIAIEELYHHSVGDPSNFYRIDDNGILWGSGNNQCGQLGQGTQDYEFHPDMVKIAENVIDVDYSQKGFVIYLTKDHKLYGVGNCGSGVMQQYDTFDWTRYVNGDHYYVSEPCLLMEGVKYARCGRDDVVCMTEDNAVWTWGCIYASEGRFSQNTDFLDKPTKILENAALVTGGWFNHAALLKDGTVWTWGYNASGNCGVADIVAVGEPTMVEEGVTMVWTDLAVNGYPQPNATDMEKAWLGQQMYDTDRNSITEFEGIYPYLLCNTVIRKADGTHWACGENVGTEEKIVHGAEGEYSVICSEKFYPCN